MIDPKDRSKQRLIHIEKACSKIKDYLSDVSRSEFLENGKTQDAVIYQLLIIGEAVVNIEQSLLDKYPYPWYKTRAFRNYAAHEYFNIQVWTVWDIADQHIKELHELVELILRQEFPDR